MASSIKMAATGKTCPSTPYSTVYWHYKQSGHRVIVIYGQVRIEELEKVYPQMMRKIRFERSAGLQTKRGTRKTWICPAVARWVIERSNAWMEGCLVGTLSELYLMQRLRSISALSGSCLSGSQSLPEISNGFYTTAAAISFFSSSFAQKPKGELEDI